MQALFQLSYSPWKFEIYCKIEACPLTVLRWLQPEINRAAAGDKLARQKVATIQFVAVSRHEPRRRGRSARAPRPVAAPGTPSFVSPARIAVSAIPPSRLLDSTNTCSHAGGTERSAHGSGRCFAPEVF